MAVANRCVKMGQGGRKKKMVCIWEDEEEPNEGGKRVGKQGRWRGKDEQPEKEKKKRSTYFFFGRTPQSITS